MNGTCRFCGRISHGELFSNWVKPTFMDWDKLLPGEIICSDCAFWFEEKSEELARRVGKEKPQRMRNYSHFIVDGQWTPLSKGNKRGMRDLLLGDPFPELAAIADSGQKHIVFRATRNERGGKSGWVQFEEQSIFVNQRRLRALLDIMDLFLSVFSKKEIRSGDYAGYRIIKFGLGKWEKLEKLLRVQRGNPLFSLAVFLALKEGNGGNDDRGNQRTNDDNLAGYTGRLQEPVSHVDLEAVRGSDSQCGVHKQSWQVRQLDLFET